MIFFGIAQRTWLPPPDQLTSSVSTAGDDTAFTVIPGKVLTSNPGQQRVQLSGGDTVWAAYARTSDIAAWLGDEPYTRVSVDAKTGKLGAKVVQPTPAATGAAATGAAATGTTALTPSGSDLWLDEKSGEGSLSWTVSVPDDVSLLIASDGTKPAPAKVTVTWPLQHSTPWAGPLIIGGGVLLLVGLGLYIWGLVHMRRTRGPRRKSPPKLPTPPRPRAIRGPRLEPATTAKGRRSVQRNMLAAGGLTLTAGLLLSGCTATKDLFEGDAAPVPTVSSTALPAAEVQPVAVTEGQLRRIVERVSSTVTQADTDRNLDTLKTRMTGPALADRTANYTMRGADAGIAAPDAIPASPVKL